MSKHKKAAPLRQVTWSPQKPSAPGRFWWSNGADDSPALVYVEKQYLGFYVLGVGWLPYQPGKWAGPVGESAVSSNN